jgi:ATP-dependent Clp protease adaptor protein ClpS
MVSMSGPESPTLTPAGGTAVEERPSQNPVEESYDRSPWATIVWDDPVNLMSYVAHVFAAYFHYSKSKAHKLMMAVHTEGKAVVATGGREEMERDVTAMHQYGLWATLDRADA